MVPTLALCGLGMLAFAAWNGIHTRPAADEWCLFPRLEEAGGGVLGLLPGFYNFDNGRVTAAVLYGAYLSPGVVGHQVFAALLVAVTVGVQWGLARSVLRVLGWRGPRGLALLLAVTAAVLFLLGSTNTYKTLYWPGAATVHTLAPVLLAGAVWAALAARGRVGRCTASVYALVVGAEVGTLSEGATLTACVLLVAVLIARRRLLHERVQRFARCWTVCALVGLLTGALVVLTSPGLANRRKTLAHGDDPLSAAAMVKAPLEWLLATADSLFSFPYLAAVALGAVAGAVATRAPGAEPVFARCPASWWIPRAVVVFLVCSLGVVVISQPGLGYQVALATRIRNNYLLFYVVLLMAIGMMLGRTIRSRTRFLDGRVTRTQVLAGLLALCGLGFFALAPPLLDLSWDMRKRAVAWDRQSAWLHRQAANGATNLPYRPLPIADIPEPFMNPKSNWTEACAARYYRVKVLTPTWELP
ncbi:hypothetical protein FE633_08965 [Streptomyces montanus]|uniref:Integral membrane protein n=1 Tax=Streptomyces montanus TaxID=2580423 RepID=A0A5R9FR49_9ACTN|nr:DUF6056 family protein [Streptomyces montanus]TLS46442.1 hypothetical protein FE633_08965 [Streptomyces montanus]